MKLYFCLRLEKASKVIYVTAQINVQIDIDDTNTGQRPGNMFNAEIETWKRREAVWGCKWPSTATCPLLSFLIYSTWLLFFCHSSLCPRFLLRLFLRWQPIYGSSHLSLSRRWGCQKLHECQTPLSWVHVGRRFCWVLLLLSPCWPTLGDFRVFFTYLKYQKNSFLTSILSRRKKIVISSSSLAPLKSSRQ